MFNAVKRIYQCLISPRLYNVHRNGPIHVHYKPNRFEVYSDLIICVADAIRHMAFYMSPFISIYLYKRGLLNKEESETFLKFCCGLGCFMLMTFLVRAYGRAFNPQYMLFLESLYSPKKDPRVYLAKVKRFDFEFYAWPATFVVPYNPENTSSERFRPFVSKESVYMPAYKKYIVKFLAYIAIHTFALRLIYPGTLGIIQYMLWTSLVQGRAKLVEEHSGKRVKIITADGNSIDTMFVDYRHKFHSNGQTLVVCSEGNSGFYENGIMNTPMKAGYSVLGWNHPGFGGSTGLPYPQQEHCAIDAVMQYAIHELKFQASQIVMFGWSIGGYSAAWAACNYNTKALMMDATFDDLLPLAVNQMPASWESLVREVIRSHVNLNVAEMTKHYRGPLHLIRRTDDEIISLTPGDIATNRGNHLLLKVISNRHSAEVDQLLQILIRYTMMPEARRPKLADPILDPDMKAMLRLILRYSSDYKSTHCNPLPTDKFEGILNYILETQKLYPD